VAEQVSDDVEGEAAPPGEQPPRVARRRQRLRIWRSPADQPRWARPLLLAVAALAALAYGWGMGSVTLEPFYGAAARSMSESWHNFFFGALDPWGTVSVDKLPGALWVQALSLRVFGFHFWSIVLPQVLEGVLTVLVLYRAVRRVAGPLAGLAAGLVLAVTPVTVLLNRGNISDSLLILLLVLAADATTNALVAGRPHQLALAGLWVGLAFQAKMLEAWLILPALFAVYLVAAQPASLLRRLWHVALSGLIVLVVSLSWMSVVSAIPAHDRPYVDGSCDNSLFSQVFVYNGLDRATADELKSPGCSPPSQFQVVAQREGAGVGLGTFTVPASWDRLLKGVFGRDDGWFLVPSLAATGSLLWLRRRRPRTDLVRASTMLWSAWLLIVAAFFSGGQYLNSYYLAALTPPMAALCGLGTAAAWRHRHSRVARLVVLITVTGSALYSILLLPGDAGVRTSVIASTAVVTLLAIGILAVSLRRHHATRWAVTVGLGTAALALLLGAGWATSSVLVAGEGPFDTPYQPASVTYLSQTLPARDEEEWPELSAYAATLPANLAIDVDETSFVASFDILATGHEYLPVGGFSGEVPSPTVRQFIRYVDEGRVLRAFVAVAPLSENPVMRWIAHNCLKQTGRPDVTFHNEGQTYQRFLCGQADIDAGR
jgi:4-amino-4-deoxy-L-arabinose transferase-like glycosyltransferase